MMPWSTFPFFPTQQGFLSFHKIGSRMKKGKKKLERRKKTFEADFSASNSKKKTTAEKKIEILC